uniref:MOCS2B n=1 Tax=Corethron hystrix TaxID=216773 RepID=A0A7S1FMY4_9STRA|mmetsp:Transcript_14064/g.30809  ORF Transcript_14064/g.30809 Transcript_14064/m.30809 type:complete len:186 (+) Transcript_14064:46-603(+)
MADPDTQPSSSSVTDGHYQIRVSGECPPNLSECVLHVTHPTCGAISTFLGTTRSTFGDKTVTSLKYEAYVPMAEKELMCLCRAATSRWPGVTRIAVHHILGECPVGRTSVIVATSSPHRKEAIESCEWLINSLKERVPIWKLEQYEESGGAVWKENLEWRGGQNMRVMAKSGESEEVDDKIGSKD